MEEDIDLFLAHFHSVISLADNKMYCLNVFGSSAARIDMQLRGVLSSFHRI